MSRSTEDVTDAPWRSLMCRQLVTLNATGASNKRTLRTYQEIRVNHKQFECWADVHMYVVTLLREPRTSY